MSQNSNSSDDLFNVPLGSFADDSPSRRSPNSYDSTDFIPPAYYPGQPFPEDSSTHRRTHDPLSTGGVSRPYIPNMPLARELVPQPGFNPYASPPAYFPYPPRNLYTAMPTNLYSNNNVPPSYHRGPSSFRPSPLQPQIPPYSGPSMFPMSHQRMRRPQMSQTPEWFAKRQRERSPPPFEPPVRTSPISSPRARKMGLSFANSRTLPNTAPVPQMHGMTHFLDSASVHRVIMGGPRTTKSLQNINRMISPEGALAGTGKENPNSGCNCKKSRCVKLYCECFAAGRLCRGCNCHDCLNSEEHGAERLKAIEHVQNRNKRIKSLPISCKCRRSACLKKYCEVSRSALFSPPRVSLTCVQCFQGGILCGDKCKCTGCSNRAGSQQLIDKRRKMKDFKGAQYAMEMAHQVWRKPATGVALRTESKQPFKMPPHASEIRTQSTTFGKASGPHSASEPPEMATPSSFEFSGDLSLRSLASSPFDEVAFAEAAPTDNDQLQRNFFGENLPSTSRSMVLRIITFLADDEKRNAMLVCKTWTSLLTGVSVGNKPAMQR